jgi:hypothetical protein
MMKGINDVVMSPKEHSYTFEINGEYIVFKDRGEFGELEDGVDVFDFEPQCREGKADESSYVAVNEITRGLYGEKVEEGVEYFRAYLGLLTLDIVDSIMENRRPVNRMSGAYIDLNMNYWCDRVSDREPYSQYIPGGHAASTKGVYIWDYSGDDKADRVIIKMPDGSRVEIKSIEDGPLQEMWNGSLEPCFDVDLTRQGLETYLGAFDVLYGRGANTILSREL